MEQLAYRAFLDTRSQKTRFVTAHPLHVSTVYPLGALRNDSMCVDGVSRTRIRLYQKPLSGTASKTRVTTLSDVTPFASASKFKMIR